MANDEKKQDLRSGVHRRLGDWLHMAMIACYMAVLFVQPAAAADDDMWTRFSDYSECLRRTAGNLHNCCRHGSCGSLVSTHDFPQ